MRTLGLLRQVSDEECSAFVTSACYELTVLVGEIIDLKNLLKMNTLVLIP